MEKSYTFEEVHKAALDYFKQDEMAAMAWIKKYCLKNDDDTYAELTPDDMHKRLAKKFSEVEEKYEYTTNDKLKLKLSEYGYNRKKLEEDDIYQLLKDFKYVVPGGSVLSGLGSKLPVSLSNCFVINSPKDSISSIFKVCNEMAQLEKRRGGVGFDISLLRPNGAKVHNSAETSTGAASFMDLFSAVNSTIAQCGRRGALMLSISIKHPDSLEFILKKQDLSKVTGANVSVQITDEFMQKVENNEDFFQTFPVDGQFDEFDKNSPYDELVECKQKNGKTGYYKRVSAKELWDKLIHCAWNTAEPGILFQTRHHNFSPDGVYPQFRMVSTNPCGEIGMQEDSCRLIHLNIPSFVDNPFTDDAKFNDEKFYRFVYEATRLGDDLVDLEYEALQRIIDKINEDDDKDESELNLYRRLMDNTLNGRRCGVGFFGLADAIAMMGMKYDSKNGIEMIDHIMRIMFVANMDSEIDMAITRGTFRSYDKKLEEKGNDWYNNLKEKMPLLYRKMMMYGRRNVSFSTVAPTGTLALLAHRTGGIEPVFMPIYNRRVKCMKPDDRVDFIDPNGEKYTEYITVHPTLKEWALAKYGEEIENYSSEKWNEIYKKSPWNGSAAQDIDWVKRTEIQGIVQNYISHSISSTVNLPNSVSEKEVSDIYMTAWKKGLKGITVYRDGCRAGVMVSVDKDDKKKDNNLYGIEEVKKRPKTLSCKIFRFSNKGEKWVGVVGMLDDKPYELFTGMLEKLNIPSWVEEGTIVKNYETVKDEDGNDVKKSRYDICYIDKDGYKVCVEGLSRIFNPEYWNYAKLISGLLRHHMPIGYLIKYISSLNMDSSTINTWKNGVIRTLKKFTDSMNTPVEDLDEKCPNCGGKIVRENGCKHCMDCDYSVCQ